MRTENSEPSHLRSSKPHELPKPAVMDRLRVVFLIENTSFPRDRRVRQEAAALYRGGCEVSVICPKGANQDALGFEIIDGIKVYRYWQPWQGTGILSYLMEYCWAMTLSFALLVWLYMRHGFDVLHAANPPDLFCIIALPFMLIGKAFVYDQHDLCPELLDSRLEKAALVKGILLFFEHLSYKLATLVIVTNESAYKVALERGADVGKLCVVRNGPDLDYFVDVKPVPELKRGASYMALYVGTLAPQDGVDRILRVADYVVHRRARRDINFTIVGDGECLRSLQVMAHTLKIEQYVNFSGWIEGPDILSYLSTADVCLAPEPPEDFNRRSSFIKLAEYMCYGKVTVSFDLEESRRTLGPAGIFVERDDLVLFGDAILEILDDPTRRQELGNTARERLHAGFHWGHFREVLLEAYETVVVRRLSLRTDQRRAAGGITDV
jgi:glycosyltransferase involved in cell wall biosynthesis